MGFIEGTPKARPENWVENREKSFLRALRVYDELEAAGDEIRAREAERIINSLCKDVWDIGRSEVSKNVWDATFLFRLRNCEPTYC